MSKFILSRFFYRSVDSTRASTVEKRPNEASSYSSHETMETKPIIDNSQDLIGVSNQKRPRTETEIPTTTASIISSDSITNLNSQQSFQERKPAQGGRCRLFIGNIPTDLTQEEFLLLFNKYGELVEFFVNPARGFGFVKLVNFSKKIKIYFTFYSYFSVHDN